MSDTEARRDFDLPEEDREHMDSLGLNWETVSESNMKWLLVQDYKVPEGYTVDKATVAIL